MRKNTDIYDVLCLSFCHCVMVNHDSGLATVLLDPKLSAIPLGHLLA